MKFESISRYLDGRAAEARTITEESSRGLAIADLIYSYHLLGRAPAADHVAELLQLIRTAPLAGVRRPAGKGLSVHLTAYLLGAGNLLAANDQAKVSALLRERDWDLDALFDARHLPRWPRHFSHHSWRVSHWIGGAPSILKSLWARIPDHCAARNWPTVSAVLQASDQLVDERTGLLRCYSSDLLQTVFRNLYRLRHDPAAGDVGGVVHLHWVNHAEDRVPYKGAGNLHARAWSLMQRTPFIEGTPYCLDFDIVQIVRTTLPAGVHPPAEIRQRAEQYAQDICAFFETGLTSGYGLHRLPGALATLHECAYLTGATEAYRLGVVPIDIIKDAYWI